MAIREQLTKLRESGPRTVTFLNEVWAEMKKVHWPPRKETYAATTIVIVVSLFVAIFLGLADFVISHVVRAILG